MTPIFETTAPSPAKPRRLLRINEVLDRLACGRTTFYEFVQAGRIPLVKIGTSSRVAEDSLDRFIESLPKAEARNAA